jgi:hypothetical protein
MYHMPRGPAGVFTQSKHQCSSQFCANPLTDHWYLCNVPRRDQRVSSHGDAPVHPDDGSSAVPLTSDEAIDRLRELLAQAGVDNDNPTADDVERTWEVMRHFSAEPVQDVSTTTCPLVVRLAARALLRPGTRDARLKVVRELAANPLRLVVDYSEVYEAILNRRKAPLLGGAFRE